MSHTPFTLLYMSKACVGWLYQANVLGPRMSIQKLIKESNKTSLDIYTE